VPVILSTAYDTFSTTIKSIAADYYVVKSVDLSELKAKVRQASRPRGLAVILADLVVEMAVLQPAHAQQIAHATTARSQLPYLDTPICGARRLVFTGISATLAPSSFHKGWAGSGAFP
jgi:DNA-binding response OmpR family regulator